MQTASVMLLPILPDDIDPKHCFMVEGSTYYQGANKRRTELWDVVLVYTNPFLEGPATAYRFLSSTQFGYGG